MAAVLNQIAGKTPDGKPATVPAIFGMNFPAVSVGQRTVGTTDAKGTPAPDLAEAIQHTDTSLAKLKAAGIEKETLIVLTAKHGQSPIAPSARPLSSAGDPALHSDPHPARTPVPGPHPAPPVTKPSPPCNRRVTPRS